MTIPISRSRAVRWTRELLFDLINSQATPKIPTVIRDRARKCLQHYPWPADMRATADACPSLWNADSEAPR